MWTLILHHADTSGQCTRCKKGFDKGKIVVKTAPNHVGCPICMVAVAIEEVKAGKSEEIGGKMAPQRLKMLHHWAVLADRERKAVARGDDEATKASLEIIKEKRLELAREIQKYGDVPKSWQRLIERYN